MERKGLSTLDLNQVFAGAFIAYYGFYESQLERLFLGLLIGAIAHTRVDVVPLVQFPTSAVAKPIVFSGRNYADWLPFDRHTRERANLYFKNGKPFRDLSQADRATLERLGIIRNALAHNSGHSLKRFHGECVEGNLLPSNQRSPAGYLRGNHALGQSRLEFTLLESVRVMRTLCSM